MLAPSLILAVIGALLWPHLQKPSYRATAEVFTNRATLVANRPTVVADSTDFSPISNSYDVLPFLIQPPRRVGDFMRAEALTARSPELAARVVAAAGVPGMSTGKFLAASTVTPAVNADFLRFSVSDSHSRYAMLLANTYASEFARYKAEKDTTGVNGALRSLNTKIEAFQAKGETTSPAYPTLLQRRVQLEAVGRMLAQQVSVLQPAANASTVRTHAVRNALLGGLFGALLGVGLVAVATRRRSRKPR
jgi:hypothetical protein